MPLNGELIGGMTARYAEWTDGSGRLVATGDGPYTDTTAVFGLDSEGRPRGPVDLLTEVRFVGIPVATVRATQTPWDGISSIIAAEVAVHGQSMNITAVIGAAVDVRPGLETTNAPSGTRVVLPPALAELGSGTPLEAVRALAARLLDGGIVAAEPLPPKVEPAGDASIPSVAAEAPPVDVGEPAEPEQAEESPVIGVEPDAAAEGGPAPESVAEAEQPVAPVELVMPPAPTEPDAAQQDRIGAVSGQAGRAARSSRNLPPADTTTQAARGAVDEPKAEADAKAGADLAARLGNAPPPSPEILKLCDNIKKAIRERRPADEDELTKADIQGAAREAGGTLNSAIQGDTDRIQGSYTPLQNTPSGTPSSGKPITDPAPAIGDPGIDAGRAAPDPVPAENLSLDADRDNVEQKVADSRIERHSTEPLAQTPPYSDVKAARDELGQVAAEGPPDVAAKEAAAIAAAKSDMAGLQRQALEALNSSRGGTVKGVGSGQRDMVGSETKTRESVSAEAQQIFADTQTKVQALIEPLSRTAMARWDAEVQRLSTEFRSHLNEVQRWIDDRHSGVGGFVVGLWDSVTGLPGWVTREYNDAEKQFGDGVCAVLLAISADVNSVIAAAQALIADARDRTETLFADLPADLQKWAETEQAKFQGQLDGLAAQTEAARTSFVTDISKAAVTAVGEVQREIEELRKKAGGLIGRIVAAIEAFIDDPIKAIINGLLSLVGIPPASFWALIDKIAEVIDQIADDPETFANNLVEALRLGFTAFFDNFGDHLTTAFWKWLFSRCGDVGVSLPRDASLGSIITFVLQLMGITWPNIRKILIRHIGEKNVALIEKAWGLVSLLIEKGPTGIYEMLKEKLDPDAIVGAIVDAAVEFAVEALIERVALKLLSMLNPAGAVLAAIELIYKVLKWIFENAARIFALVETVVNACANIMAGALGPVAKMIEDALASLLPLVIDLLAGIIGLGDLPKQVAGAIGRMQEMVLPVVEEVIVAVVVRGRALLASFGIGGKDEQGEADGKADEELGTTVRFESAGTPHRIWVAVTGSKAQLMVASTPGPIQTKLSQWRKQVEALPDAEAEKKQQATALLDELTPLVSSADAEATELVDDFQEALHDSDPQTKPPSDDPLEASERRVAELVDQLFTLLEAPPDYAAIITRFAPVVPGFANRRIDDLALTWAQRLQAIQIGPLEHRQPLFTDPLAALAGLSFADGGAVLSDYNNQKALAPFFLLAGSDRDPDTDVFFTFVFVSPAPRPPHRVRRTFMQAIGDAAVARIRAYVLAQLPTYTLSDEERAKISESLDKVSYVLSAASTTGYFTGLGTREPDHPYFMPRQIVRDGTKVRYLTESGQEFDIEVDGVLPRKVVGFNLTDFMGRGVTQDSPGYVADHDFNRAHVIANRFGGSGYRSAKNLVTTSDHYNKVLMRGAEDAIAAHVAAYVTSQSAGQQVRVRPMSSQQAVVTFTLSVALEYVDAIIRLLAQAIANSPEIPDKDATIRAEILTKLADAGIDSQFKRVTKTDYDLTELKFAAGAGPGYKTEIGEDEWLLSHLSG